MRIEIQDIASGQSLHSEIVNPTGETADTVATRVLQNQNVNNTGPETIQVAVWLNDDQGITTPDAILEGAA